MLENDVAANGAGYGGNKLDNRLVGHAHGLFEDATPKNLSCNPLFLSKAAIKSPKSL